MAIDASREAVLADPVFKGRAADLDPSMPGRWYVTIHRGKRRGYLAGPYTTAGEANAVYEVCRALAIEVDRQAIWDVFATANVLDPEDEPKKVVFTPEQIARGTLEDPEKESQREAKRAAKQGRKPRKKVADYIHR